MSAGISRFPGLRAIFRKHRNLLLLIAALSLVAGLGWIDLYVDRELSFLVLYLGPVLLAGWYLGQWAAFVVSLASAAVWIIDEISAAYSYAHPSIPYWNLGAKFVIFLLFGYLITWLRKSLEREHRAERERADREVQIAKEVQSLMFPQSMPVQRTLDCSGICLPAREVSGDYYDCFPVDNDHLALAIADVSGKGIPAALLMARLQALLRMHVRLHRDCPADLVREINRGMFLGDGTGKYATLVYALYDDKEKQLTCVNAGHNTPFLIRAGSKDRSARPVFSGTGVLKAVNLEEGGLPLGIFQDVTYQQQTVSLAQGDVLVFYTDGVVETRSPTGEEFGMERLIGVVSSARSLSSQELQGAILDEINRFRGDTEPVDDLTLVIGKVL